MKLLAGINLVLAKNSTALKVNLQLRPQPSSSFPSWPRRLPTRRLAAFNKQLIVDVPDSLWSESTRVPLGLTAVR